MWVFFNNIYVSFIVMLHAYLSILITCEGRKIFSQFLERILYGFQEGKIDKRKDMEID